MESGQMGMKGHPPVVSTMKAFDGYKLFELIAPEKITLSYSRADLVLASESIANISRFRVHLDYAGYIKFLRYIIREVTEESGD